MVKTERFFIKFAFMLAPFNRAFFYLCIASVALLFYGLLFASLEFQDTYLPITLLVLLWSVLLQLLIASYANERTCSPTKGLWQRIKGKILNFFRQLLLIAFILLIITTVWISMRMVMILQSI